MNAQIRTVHARDPLREQAAQACDDAQAQVNQWAREITTAQDVNATLRNLYDVMRADLTAALADNEQLAAENNLLREERDQALYERDSYASQIAR